MCQTGATFWPDTREDCYLLLNVFLANVDPIHRVVHRPVNRVDIGQENIQEQITILSCIGPEGSTISYRGIRASAPSAPRHPIGYCRISEFSPRTGARRCHLGRGYSVNRVDIGQENIQEQITILSCIGPEGSTISYRGGRVWAVGLTHLFAPITF
jgi:hypothetical protein